ncbi:hypothetical protein OBBRIDRAFT_142287 [Obba rivulosa]|uniref:DUF6533 domain-containing protein n=1 Tax=Obba rivulosa TaxID=1052685 RepID=A0A8E2DRD4_9APHY|nr:hypothetical protein OBBRIDRAFT_142287 [Obba rivulosa]
MSTSLAEQERLLLQAAQDHYALNLSTAASIAWLVYDIILTLPQEFELVWRSKFTVHKALYVVTRYFGLACLIVTLIGMPPALMSVAATVSMTRSLGKVTAVTRYHYPYVCRRWLWFIGLGPSISNATGELLFMTRIYAAYGRTRRIFVTLLLLWLAEGIVGWVATTLNIKATMMIQRPLGYPLPGCTEDQTPIGFVHLDFVSWAVSSAVAVCLSTLILVYFFRSLNFHMSIRTSQGLKLSELKKLAPVMVLFTARSPRSASAGSWPRMRLRPRACTSTCAAPWWTTTTHSPSDRTTPISSSGHTRLNSLRP